MKKKLSPPITIQKLSLLERNTINDYIEEGNTEGIEWLEKFRKFISFHNRNLRKVSQIRFMEDCDDHLDWFREIFIKQLLKSQNSIIDCSLINAALIVNDACVNDSKHSQKLNFFLRNLEERLLSSEPNEIETSSHIKKFNYSFKEWRQIKQKDIPITLFCPSPYSLFSISVLQILLLLNVPIKAIVVLQFSPSRIKSEFYRDGFNLFFKRVWRKLILKSDENSEKAKISLKSLKNVLISDQSSLKEITKLNKIKYLKVSNFEASLNLDKNQKGDICIFTGGGLISSNILNYFKLGIINVHMGPLPQYKGMDVVEAPILDGYFDSVALTAHLMQKKIDSGPVISELIFSSDDYDSIGLLRNEMAALMPIVAVDALAKLFSKSFKPVSQMASGKQYYFIHSELREIMNRVMMNRVMMKRLKKINIRKKNLRLFEIVSIDLNDN